MKKILTVVFSVLALVMMNFGFSGAAEAAKVAVVPLQVNEAQVERAGDFTSYYWDIVIDKFAYPDFDLLDDTEVAKAVPEEGLASFDRATLMDVASRTGADIVVAMRLDKVEETPLNGRREPTLECFMQGEYAAYNGVTGKYYGKKIYYREEMEEVLTVRNDWQQQAFASNLRRYIYRTLKVK